MGKPAERSTDERALPDLFGRRTSYTGRKANRGLFVGILPSTFIENGVAIAGRAGNAFGAARRNDGRTVAFGNKDALAGHEIMKGALRSVHGDTQRSVLARWW